MHWARMRPPRQSSDDTNADAFCPRTGASPKGCGETPQSRRLRSSSSTTGTHPRPQPSLQEAVAGVPPVVHSAFAQRLMELIAPEWGQRLEKPRVPLGTCTRPLWVYRYAYRQTTGTLRVRGIPQA